MPENLQRASEHFLRGALEQAEHLCRQVIAASQETAGAHVLLGKIFRARDQVDLAQNAFNAAIQAEPTCADAWLQWSLLLQALGHPAKAEECLSLGLRYSPESQALDDAFARLLLHQGKLDDAAQRARRTLESSPQSAASWLTLGIVYGRQSRATDAASALREAIRLDPTLAEAHNHLGEILSATDMAAAAQSFTKALQYRADYAEALDSLGAIDVFNGDLKAALEKFDQALSAKPKLLRAVGHKTTTLFLMGRLREAWSLYRRRFEVEGLKHDPHGRFPQPVWNGEPLRDRRLLVWTDLGLGEEIMQASALPDASTEVSRLTVECSPRLESLFKRSFPEAVIIPRTNPTRACTTPIDADLQVSGGDLGGIFRNDWSAFPKHGGYLKADPVRVESLRAKYNASNAPLVVGVSWASKQSRFDRNKSLGLAEFAPILTQKDVVFVSLQYAADPAEITAVRKALGVDIICDNTIDPAGDLDDVAAQVAAMDLVICVSNTVAHVAGALNVPVWNIIPAHNTSGMWHWFQDMDRSPWYPSMKIYRRTEKTNDRLMGRLADDLRAASARRA